MSSLNKVFLMGNLTFDPEVRYTPKGNAVVDLRMAVNQSFQAQDGSTKEEVLYIDVTVWGRQAETCGQYLSKGAPIHVEGRLQMDQWQDKDGKKMSRIRIRGERVQFLSRPRASADYQDAPGGGAAPPPQRRPAPAPAARAAGGPPPRPVDDEPPLDEDDIPF